MCMCSSSTVFDTCISCGKNVFNLSRERCTQRAEKQTKGAELKHTRLSSITVKASVWVCIRNFFIGTQGAGANLSTHKGVGVNTCRFYYTSSVCRVTFNTVVSYHVESNVYKINNMTLIYEGDQISNSKSITFTYSNT